MTFLPIVERELRTTARKPWTYWWRCGTALGALTVLLLTMLSESGSNPPAVVSKEAFGNLSFITMILCLLAGSFQTYDCLSAEKRDGTIGLLFLTDLKGYDVVLGKLAANSLHTIYGLAALLPVLAIPLLAGGVTAGEFWRVVAVLLASLFFSLGVGMCVSAFSRETRLSLATALMVVIFFTAILPVLHEVPLEIFRVKATPTCMFWPCAGYALAHAEDTVYNYRPGREDYWCSMVTIVGLGFAGLLIAAWRLPRAWQDRAHSSQKRKRPGFWRRLRYGSPRRIGRRRALLDRNPMQWLCSRDRTSRLAFWILAALPVPLWLLFLFKSVYASSGFSRMILFQVLFCGACGLALAFKGLVAAEASRRFSEDHNSGALELILVTPLQERQIVAGQRRALRDLFLRPVLLIEMGFLLLLILCITGEVGFGAVGPNHELVIMSFGNLVALVTDFYALCWVGMWMGLRARSHNRAIISTLLRILVLPWILWFVLGAAGFFNAASVVPLLVVWFSLSIVNDLFWAWVAKRGLRLRLRRLAAQGEHKASRPKSSKPVLLGEYRAA